MKKWLLIPVLLTGCGESFVADSEDGEGVAGAGGDEAKGGTESGGSQNTGGSTEGGAGGTSASGALLASPPSWV